MAVVSTVKKNHYQDSMKLMRISQQLSSLPGVESASAIMATEANIKMLIKSGLINEAPESAGANDLIVAVRADSEEAAKKAIESLDTLLAPSESDASQKMEFQHFGSAYAALSRANIAVVSVPGEYAKLEVLKAIESGIHTFLFSDNLSVQEEVELKKRARARGLLMMGPDCGTAIINGVGLGFSNVVRRGPVGVVAASGTGMQEVTSLIHNYGSGISHAIGVGGRDLSEEVGGIMTIQAIKMLEQDGDTEVLLLVSKPPSEKVADEIIDLIRELEKPTVICFLGSKSHKEGEVEGNIEFSSTLAEAVAYTFKLMNKGSNEHTHFFEEEWKKRAHELIDVFDSEQRYLRGLFSGGTLCYEAQQILTPTLGDIYSNVPLDKKNKLENSNRSRGHTLVDLGEEEFTEGRLHPMIDATLRKERLIKEASDPTVAVVLFDVVLGYVASPDPAGDLLPAIREAKQRAKDIGRSVAFVAHVCGTEDDPQNLKTQAAKLEDDGIMVLPTNALASEASGWITTRAKNSQGL